MQYNLCSLLFSWFALANLWLTFSIIIDLLPEQNIYIFGNATVVRSLFRCLLTSLRLLGRPTGSI